MDGMEEEIKFIRQVERLKAESVIKIVKFTLRH
jgi:hypothetical protein